MTLGQIFVTISTNNLPLHIQRRILRVALNKPLPWSHLVSHQHIEGLVGFHSFFNRHFQDCAFGGVHGGVPQGFGVHFSQAFVAPYLWLFAVVFGLVLFDQGIALFVGVDEEGLLAF